MLRGNMSAAGVGGVTFIERTIESGLYCDILQKTMLKSIKELRSHSMFQHDNDPKYTSKMTTKSAPLHTANFLYGKKENLATTHARMVSHRIVQVS
ncbi:Hypothetical predicted protein [Octopus vulgaris]|uniref:Uncharacterized protein n=1 Tax=Octopus vulgaris TaxID=6645 RepID=A0AA36B2R5_OCTVU|nr:Hypothetical predicted protein [Octopus vulgaris]